jgi:hypothetical protein
MTDALTRPAWVAWDEIQRDGYCVRCGDALSAGENEPTRHATERVYAKHRECLPDAVERKEKEQERAKMREKSVQIRLVEGVNDPLSKLGSAGKHVVAWTTARLKSVLPDRDAIRSMFSLVADEKWVNHFDPVVRARHARVLLALAEFSDFVAEKYEVTAKLKSGALQVDSRRYVPKFDCFREEATKNDQQIKDAAKEAMFDKLLGALPLFEKAIGKLNRDPGHPGDCVESARWSEPTLARYGRASAVDPAKPKGPKTIVGFLEAQVMPGNMGNVTLTPNMPFQPIRLAIPKKIAKDVTLMGFSISYHRVFNGPIPGDALDSLSEMGEIEMPFMYPGMQAILDVRNDSDKPVLMQAALYGSYVDPSM